MKSTWKWLIGALALVLLIVGAYLLYDRLGDNYKGDRLVIDTPQTDADGDKTTEAQPAETSRNGEQAEVPADSESETTKEEPAYSTAPDFTVTDYNGNKVKLSDMKGKPVVINFWATWCYYCKVEMPDFENVYKEYGEDIVFMMVNMTDGVSETISSAKKHIKDEGYTFPVYFDTDLEAAYAYTVSSLPATYFVDANGNLIAHAISAIDADTLKYGISLITISD